MTKTCPQCNQEIPEYSKFCPHCSFAFKETAKAAATESVVVCSVCGEFNNPEHKFCVGCGAPLSGERKDVAIESAPEQPVRPVTAPKGKKNSGKQAEAAPVSKDISKAQMIWIFAVLVIAGAVILITGGVFSEPAAPRQIAQQAMPQSEQKAGPDLSLQPKIDSVEAMVKADPKNADLQLQFARLLDDARFYDRAITEYKKYITANPTNPDAVVDLGVCYFNLRNLDQAEALFLSALKLKPEHTQALFNLGIINLNKQKPEEAAKWFNKVIETAPGSQEADQAKTLLQSHINK